MNGGLPHPLASLRAGWKIILACVVVIVILAGGYTHTRTKTYASLMTLQLVAADPTQTSDTAARVLLDTQNYALGDVVINEAAKKLQVTPAILKSHIKIAAQADSDSILVQVESNDPGEAEFAVKTVANSMVAHVGDLRAAYYLNLGNNLFALATQQADIVNNPKASASQKQIAQAAGTAYTQQATTDFGLANSSTSSLQLASADPTPAAAEGTSTSTSLLIAAILGLLLGSAWVLGRAGLRRTVDPSEMVAGGAVEGVPVIGVVGRKGDQDITADVLLDVLVAARAAEPNHETLVVAGLTRDAAARDLARALADLSAKGQATVLVDADLGSDGRPATSPTEGLSKRPQLADLLRRARAAAGKDELFQRAEPTVPVGTAPLVVPAGEAYGETTALLPYVPRVLDRMREQAEVVIAIAPPLNTAAGRSVAASADVVVVVSSEKRTRRADLNILASGPVPAATQVIGLVAIADAWVRPAAQPTRPVRADATVSQPSATPTTAATPPAGAATITPPAAPREQPAAPVSPAASAAPAAPVAPSAPRQGQPQPATAQPRPTAHPGPAPAPTARPAAAPQPATAPQPAAAPRPPSEPWPTAADFRPPVQTAPSAAASAPSASPAEGVDPWPEARPTPFGDAWPKVDLNTPVERDSRWDIDSEWGTGWTTQENGNGANGATPNGGAPNGTSTPNGTATNGTSPNGGTHRAPPTSDTPEPADGRHPRPPWNRFTRDR